MNTNMHQFCDALGEVTCLELTAQLDFRVLNVIFLSFFISDSVIKVLCCLFANGIYLQLANSCKGTTIFNPCLISYLEIEHNTVNEMK